MDVNMNKIILNRNSRVRKPKDKSKAQSLVEFAIVLPVILVTLFVLIELARVLHAWLAVENGARAGVRYAVTTEYNPIFCPAGGCSSDEHEINARIDSIHDAAWAGSSSIVRVGWDDNGDPLLNPDEESYFNVVVCSPEDLLAPSSTFDSYNCQDGEDPGEPGDPVVVVVEFNHPLLTPLLTSIWPQLRLDSKRQATVETYNPPMPVGTAPAFFSPTPKPTNTPAPTDTSTSPPPPVDICESYTDFHKHGPGVGSNYIQLIIHEGHGIPNGPTFNEANITYMEFNQFPNTTTLLVEKFELSHPGMSPNKDITIGEKDDDVSWTGNEPLFYCYPNNCNPSETYRGMIIKVFFQGTLDGVYWLEAHVSFPGYADPCIAGVQVDTNPPEPEPSDTDGPSPTDDPWEPPEPSDTPSPTSEIPEYTPTNPGDT
jgi:hypothetical protein